MFVCVDDRKNKSAVKFEWKVFYTRESELRVKGKM